MRRVIDIHVHMGDIFLGRNVSFRTFQPRPEELDDHFAENGRRGFNFTVVGKTPAELEHRMRQGIPALRNILPPPDWIRA